MTFWDIFGLLVLVKLPDVMGFTLTVIFKVILRMFKKEKVTNICTIGDKDNFKTYSLIDGKEIRL
jgi:hypothetical protein